MPGDETGDGPEINPARIRTGYIMIGVVTLIALVLAVVVSDPAGRVIFVVVALMGGAQAWRLRRRERAER